MIYSPEEDSFLLAEQVRRFAYGRVLDLGTGSGIQAEAALQNPAVSRIVAADINKECIDYVKGLGLENVTAIHSDLFSNIAMKFDTIIFNPPYLPDDESEDKESKLITTGGNKGYGVFERFISQAGNYLTKEGRIIMVFSSITDKNAVNNAIIRNGFRFSQLSSQRISFEELFVYVIERA